MGGWANDHDPAYTALCSRLTIYSDKEGFFREFIGGLMEEVAEKTAMATTLGIGQAFSGLRMDNHRVQYVAALSKVTELEPPALYRSKSGKEAHARREEGNSALKAGDLRKALMLYSASVMRAPGLGADKTVDDGLSLPYALANRSAALQQLNRPDLACRDAKLSLSSGYPEAKKHIILERIGKCEEARGLWLDALAAYEGAFNSLSKKDKGGEVGARLQKSIQRCTQGKKEVKKKTKLPKVKKELPPLTGGSSDLLPNASKSVGVAEVLEEEASETEDGPSSRGRFAVAMSDISAGDTLVAEPAFASVLLPEKAGTHCHHCFSRLYAPLPCPRCSGVAFCGSECRDAAESTYHPHECPIGSTLIAAGLSLLSRLALRILTKAPIDVQVEALEDFQYDPQLGKLWTKEEEMSQEGQMNENRATTEGDNKENEPVNRTKRKYYDAKDYHAIMNLTTLSDERAHVDNLERTAMAVFLIKCLRHTPFFKKPGSRELEERTGLRSEEELRAGQLLLHYIQMLQFNAHEIFETLYEKEFRFKVSKTQYLGVGIYPTVALFNHDCYPAVTRYFIGTSMVLQALRPLKAGEAIPENYGSVFTKQKLRDRQRILRSRYWFICRCDACLKDWPTYDAMEESAPIKLKCAKEGCPNIIPTEAEVLEEREQLLRPQKDGDGRTIETTSEKVEPPSADGVDGKSEGKKKNKSRKTKAVKCSSCATSSVNQLDKFVRSKGLFEDGLSAMEKAGAEGSRPDLEKAMKLLYKSIHGWNDSVHPPYRQHMLAQDSLRLCINSQGNSFIVEKNQEG